jgi:ribosomal protein S18 acetylase RimI-like enzyme
MAISKSYNTFLRDQLNISVDRSFDLERFKIAVVVEENGRYDHLKERWELLTLTVHPSFQRRGIGKLLLKECCKLADSEGVPTVVDASQAGEALYAKGGFKHVSVLNFAPTEKIADGSPKVYYLSMIRQPELLKEDTT